jgi:hypothetical protein
MEDTELKTIQLAIIKACNIVARTAAECTSLDVTEMDGKLELPAGTVEFHFKFNFNDNTAIQNAG